MNCPKCNAVMEERSGKVRLHHISGPKKDRHGLRRYYHCKDHGDFYATLALVPTKVVP